MRISLCAPAAAEGARESCAERGPSASPRAGSPGGGKGTRSPRGVVCALPCHGQSQSPGQAPSQGVGRHLLPMEVRETAESQGKSGENRRQLRNRSGRQAHSIHVFAAFSLSLSVSPSLMATSLCCFSPFFHVLSHVVSCGPQHLNMAGSQKRKVTLDYFVLSSVKSQRRIFFFFWLLLPA